MHGYAVTLMQGLKNFRRHFKNAMDAGLGIILAKLVFGLIIIGVVTNVIPNLVRGMQPAQDDNAKVEASAQGTLPVPGRVPAGGVLRNVQGEGAATAVILDEAGSSGIEYGPGGRPSQRPPTPAEVRESKRRADEAMRILEASTPEM